MDLACSDFSSLILIGHQDATEEESTSPEYKEPVSNSDSQSQVADALDIFSFFKDEESTGHADAVASTLPEGSQIEAESQEWVLMPEIGASTLLMEPNDKSPNSNGEIRRRTNIPANEDGRCSSEEEDKADRPGSTREVEQAEGDKLRKLNDLKILLFDTTTTFLGVLFPLFTMVFGIHNVGKCAANFSIPYMIILVGLLGASIVLYALAKTGGDNFVSLGAHERIVIQVFSWLLAFLWLLEVGQLFSTDVSFDRSAANYCDHWFYIFTIVLNIFLVLGFVIGYALLHVDPDNLKVYLDHRAEETPEDLCDWIWWESMGSSNLY